MALPRIALEQGQAHDVGPVVDLLFEIGGRQRGVRKTFDLDHPLAPEVALWSSVARTERPAYARPASYGRSLPKREGGSDIPDFCRWIPAFRLCSMRATRYALVERSVSDVVAPERARSRTMSKTHDTVPGTRVPQRLDAHPGVDRAGPAALLTSTDVGRPDAPAHADAAGRIPAQSGNRPCQRTFAKDRPPERTFCHARAEFSLTGR